MLFMSAGVLAHALQGTTFANKISELLIVIAEQSFLLFAMAVMALVLLVTYIGIHQIAVIAALAMQLNADELGISTLSLAMLLLLTWSISAALSPFSGLNLMVSRLVGMTGVQTGLRTNGVHLLVLAILGISFVMMVK
jgi:TRAP-type C4-dicarboxylate transport system permease large subunit